jgi:hypothetical protein
MKILSLLTALAFSVGVYADGGLWNIESAYPRLSNQGIQISKNDFYSEDNPSLVDAVCSFADAGTCSFISSNGLLLTNYHLAVKFIKQNSTVKNNYIDFGFCAKNLLEELQCEGLYIKQQIKHFDVTEEINKEINKGSTYEKISKAIILRLTPKEHGYKGVIKSQFNGYRYSFYLFRIIDDIRLVYAPPYEIAKYGDEKLNFMWPRRSADMAIFRAYVKNKDGKKIPFIPSKFISISHNEIKKDDFVMTVGFPKGAMNDRLSTSVKVAISSDVQRVRLMNIRLKIMKNFMKKNDSIRLQLITLYSALSNEMKKKEGFVKDMSAHKSIEMLEDRENKCVRLIEGHSQDSIFSTQLIKIRDIYIEAKPYMPSYDYYREGILGVSILQIAEYVNQSLKEGKKAEIIAPILKSMYSLYNPNMDKEIMYEMFSIIMKTNPTYIHLSIKDRMSLKCVTNEIYEKSIFNNEKKLFKTLYTSPQILNQDIALRFMSNIDSIVGLNCLVKLSRLSQKADSINNLVYLTMAKSGIADWPNADGTLRVSYGRVIDNDYYTSPDHGLSKLYQKYGLQLKWNEYNSKKTINFLSNCHTSGGNSGSPVLDSKGNLVGLNFDRRNDGLSSDYIYNIDICRNIIVSSKYILTLLGSNKNSSYLLKEINITD